MLPFLLLTVLDIPLPVLNGIGVVGLWSFIGYLSLTDKLIWHTRHQKLGDELREDRDYWRDMALRGLGVAEKTTTYAEVATDLIAQQARPGEGG